MDSDTFKSKMKETTLERYGVEYCMQNKEIYEKTKKTNLEKYGFEHCTQNEDIKNKQKETIKNKTQEEKEDIKNKRKDTCLEKYGVENAIHNTDVYIKTIKSQYTLKEYILPSGKIITCQGYEPFALDILLKKLNEEAVITETKDIPRIKYQLDNKNHYYFPDIFLPLENKIIEVKSKYTYDINLDKNLAKLVICLNFGFLIKIKNW